MGYEKSFIEVQFPVSKISKESYKERKANLGQTLTGLGKWWGRKPLILVRATLLGTLMPATNNPKKDREIFLKILTMDREGLFLRKSKNICSNDIFSLLDEIDRIKFFTDDSNTEKSKLSKQLSQEQKKNLQKLAFDKLSYDKKLNYCIRPEQAKNINKSEWNIINEYLGTSANNLQELIKELGYKKFGHVPKVGDCFSGGGSIPFETARMGAETYASDLNPIAALLTWADLNIANKNENEINALKKFQDRVYNAVDKEICSLNIEHNEEGHRADSYLYCNEVRCPECSYKVPLAPSWIIGKGTMTVALLKDNGIDGFDIEVIEKASSEQLIEAEKNITVKSGKIYCPHCKNEVSVSVIRGDRKDKSNNIVWGLRKWDKNQFISEDDDVFTERLYAIRYVNEFVDDTGKYKKVRYYTKPSINDMEREKKVIELISENIKEWQDIGYIPSAKIQGGYNTDQPVRERGWQYWHQLFNPRQLLMAAFFIKNTLKLATNIDELTVGLLGINKIVDWNSKLCVWHNGGHVENGQNTFLNQALNTLYNYGVRALVNIKSSWEFKIPDCDFNSKQSITVCDARDVKIDNDIWITDPPYADAVNYHELSEFFLSWDKKIIEIAFPEWYSDSKRVLAVKGTGADFNSSMIEVYSNLAEHMSDNGLQIVMFTHQDVKVWAELAMILWSSGLQVTAAWNIATETESGGLKDGNYVKGTVLLVLRKQTSEETAYLDELYPEIEEEVKNQIDCMREVDDKEDPNFSDPDYLLAAYAASLKVLTSYKSIEDIDVKYELSKNRNDKEETPIQKIINEAKKIAYDYLIPVDFDNYLWKELKPVERFYLKGLEFEMNNMCKLSGYQELAKGFGVNEYNWMLGSTKANFARVKTPKEFAMRNINDNSVFGQSLLRHVLASIYIALKEENANKGLNWLKTEVNDYWNNRNMLVEILNYLSKVEVIDSMEHWKECAHEAFILKNLLENDSI